MKRLACLFLSPILLTLHLACGGDASTPSRGSDLTVSITGLDSVPGDVNLTGPNGFQEHLTSSRTILDLPEGEYTLTAATVPDVARSGLGGALGPANLQRHPLAPRQTFLLGSTSATVSVNYPAALVSVPIPTSDGSSVPMEFILLPAGHFLMGSEDPLDSSMLDAQTPHLVSFETAIYMARTPCTQAQWKAVMGSQPSAFSGDSQNPVEQVSWNQIRAAETGFIDRLKLAMPGYGFRLPSEAEYEYACRAGTTDAYFWGAETTELSTYAWWPEISDGHTHPVATKAPNPWGLHDIVGNVWEWTEDDGHGGYAGSPVDGRAWVDAPRSGLRVLRGGSWSPGKKGVQDQFRSAFRVAMPPDTVLPVAGFRLVLSVSSTGR